MVNTGAHFDAFVLDVDDDDDDDVTWIKALVSFVACS